MVLAFRQLGADDVRARLIRRDRPYALITDGRFEQIDLFVQRLLQELGLQGTVKMTYAGATTRLDVSIFVPAHDSEPSPESPAAAIVDGDAEYKIALTDGRFESAVGFTLETDGAVAVLDKKAFDDLEPGSTARLAIVWTH